MPYVLQPPKSIPGVRPGSMMNHALFFRPYDSVVNSGNAMEKLLRPKISNQVIT